MNKFMRPFFIFCLLFVCLYNSNTLSAQCYFDDLLPEEQQSLTDLYNATDGDNWINNQNWLDTDVPVENWEGISVDTDCHIIGIDISGSGLSGTIPDLNLPNLITLTVVETQLSGNIPNFTNLPNLQELDLLSNQLSGSIPDFTNLPNLRYLGIRATQITGEIPNFTNLPNLQSLFLNNNQLSGSIPNFTNLPNLWYLVLNDNQLSGNIPNFTNLPNLQLLSLDDNQLSGNIPNFTNLPNLQKFYLNNNQLSGNIPNFTNLPNLQYLELGNNQLSGNIPNLTNLLNLQLLSIDYNQLNGNIPNFTNLPNLQWFFLNNNQLSGDIPNFTNLPNLQNLFLGYNQLSGNIPNFNNLPNLQLLSLGNNQISGNIPNFANLPNLQNLYLRDNQLNGNIPNFTNLPNLQWFFLNNNQLSGDIPNFTNLPNLQVLYLDLNQLSGSIPNFTNLPNLQNLYFSNNQLSGNIPNFTNLPNLQELSLGTNQLSGNIPNFTNLPNLQNLNLYNNQLSGNISNFTNLPNLQGLSLNDNQLSGNIPDFTNLPNLQVLSLGTNQLNGNIPNFNNLPNLQDLSIDNNQLSGNIPNFNNLSDLWNLRLNGNQLSGNIPDFTNLPNLHSLYLNNNQLNGNIPNFTNLPNLQYLLANNNQLSGNIPNFTNLPNLYNLVVCPGNNLGGFIPNFANCPFLNVNAMDFSCVRSVHLIGTAYYDINNNCQQDTDEPSVPNALIQVNGGEHYAYTNNNGNYHIGADVGTYTLSVQAPNVLWDTSMVCTNTFSVTTENYGDTLYQNFALQANILCSLLSVDIGTAELRPCFSSVYNVQYCNQGTLPEEAAYIDITLPEELILQTAELPYTQPQAGVYRFEVGNLAIGQCNSFTFTVLVDCGATLGTTACVSANINPIPDCWSSLVDGYQLAVSGDCNGNEVLFTIENLNGDMPDSTQYRIYQDDILSAVGNVKLQSMEQKNISITGNGSLYRLVVKNNSTSIYASDPQALVANCGGNSLFGAFLLNISEGDDSPFFERDCQIIIGSYDPNDKQAVPRGIGEQHIVAKNEEIEFTVRFQNTGTADAINIFILDTLDLQNLDFSTLRMGIVSHEYTTELTGNVLRINFDNIHLPDSTTNEPASHGFVKYHIRTKSNLNGGEIISNTANIYFDYNAPITTNTTQHTINQAPTAIDDNTEVLKNEATLLNLIMNDLNDEGTPQISGFTAPIHGTLSALNNQLLYLPNPNYLGTDVFSYFITDYFGETDTATVVLQVVNALIVGDIPPQTFSLYPNPTQGQLSVVNIGALHTNANAQFLLFDVVGRQVFSTTLSAQNSTILQLGQLPTALYSYKIVNQQNETLQTGKLTVMNY